MALAQALLYLLAILLLALAACGVKARVSLPLIGAASAVLAYGLPAIHTGLS